MMVSSIVIGIRVIEISIFREGLLLIKFQHYLSGHSFPSSAFRQIVKMVILSKFHRRSLALCISSLVLFLSDRELDVIWVYRVDFLKLMAEYRGAVKHPITLHSYLVGVIKIRLGVYVARLIELSPSTSLLRMQKSSLQGKTCSSNHRVLICWAMEALHQLAMWLIYNSWLMAILDEAEIQTTSF